MYQQMIPLSHWMLRLIVKPVLLIIEPFTMVSMQCTNQLILILKYRPIVSLLTKDHFLPSMFLIIIKKGRQHLVMKIRKTFQTRDY